MTVLTDKEETGSDGNTGLNSSYLKYFVEDWQGLRAMRVEMFFLILSAFQPTLMPHLTQHGQLLLKKIIPHSLTRVFA
mgnify:CR=1 FL=1